VEVIDDPEVIVEDGLAHRADQQGWFMVGISVHENLRPEARSLQDPRIGFGPGAGEGGGWHVDS
jgi:hypothetical protein